MNLSEYFEKATGRGVLATADSEGKVDAAVYSMPHFMGEETVAFIMGNRLTHKNLESNPHAAYLFMESREKFVGKRLFLTKIKEETDSELIDELRRRRYHEYKSKTSCLVYFHIDKVLPLIGNGE